MLSKNLSKILAEKNVPHEGVKKINEFDGYGVTRDGRVYSFKNKRFMYLTTSGKKEYLYVQLWNNGKQHKRNVHRLVAQAFIERKPGLDVVNHIDGNKLNNNVDNLEWTTLAGNNKHAMKNKLNARGTDIKSSKLNGKEVAEIREKYKTGRFLQREIADEHGLSQSTISLLLSRKTWSWL